MATPWTAKDAVGKNAALAGKPKLQKLWADTANGTLQSETEKGTEATKAAGIAIATANKAVGKKIKGRGEPHGASGKPQKPVRTVTAAPAVSRADETALRTRAGQLSPGSIDLDAHSVEAVLGTERACLSMDLKTKKSFLEVYLMSGAVLPAQVPLCDTHSRDSVSKVLGSVRDIRVEGDQLVGRLFIDQANYEVWSKIRDKHLTDVSWGVQPLETTEIKSGKTQEIQGRSYTAPADRSLFIHSKWRLREESITPIGSDDRAKIRSLFQGSTMNELIRKWLEENFSDKLRAESTPEEVQTFWDSLSNADRARAEEACREDDDEEEEEDEEEEDDDGNPKKTLHRVTRQSVVTEETRAAEANERIRSEAHETAVASERKRCTSIRKAAGSDVPAEIVTRAIDDGWSLKRFRGVALECLRGNRTRSVGGGGNTNDVEMVRSLFGDAPSGHIRSHETDCTVASLSAAMLTRGYHGNQDPCNILGGYQASASMIDESTGKQEGGRCHTVRSDITRMLSGQTRAASDERRKAAERLLDQGDRYRGMSMMDLVDECNRIEGRTRTTFDSDERIRAAFSGSALAAIFTQNVSAQFLGGYLDAEDTSMGLVTETDVPNFLQNERAIYGKMGQLKKLGKGGTAKDLDTSDWNEVYKIFRYAGKFTIDEQDFINDRFGALAQMSPMDMGLTARQIRCNLLVAHLMAPNAANGGGNGPTLNQDAYPLFCTYHNNVVSTGTITDFSLTNPTASAGALQMATSLMGKQRLRNRVLNLRPRFAWFGNDLEWAMNILYKSQQRIIASGSGGTYNPLAAEGANLVLKQEGRFDPLGCYDNDSENTIYPYSTTGVAGTGYSGTCILIARPGEQGAKTSEVGYRAGTGRAPRIRSAILREGSGQYGMSWDVNLDIGVRGLDFRGMQLITSGGTQAAVVAGLQ